MRKTVIAVAIAGCLSLIHVPHAEAVQIRGARSCGAWVEQNKEAGPAAIALQSWVVGFLSGLALQSNQDFLEGTDNESIFLWLTNYCQANPLVNLAAAADTLSIELTKKKSATKSKK